MEYGYPHISESDLQWTFEGKSYDLDLTDEDVREHFQKCAMELTKTEIKNVKSLAKALSHFLDSVLGVGVGVEILGARPRLRTALNCKNSIIAYAKALTYKIRKATQYGANVVLAEPLADAKGAADAE